MKRRRNTFEEEIVSSEKSNEIDETFLKKCRQEFNDSEKERIAKNSITLVGCLNSVTEHSETSKVSHVFLNSLKKKNLKATNQGASGRCWLFSGLNVFRHNVIEALKLENFEFSETYLFFYDKIERSNCFLQWIKDECMNKTNIYDDKLFDYLIDPDKYMSDGGFWNFFVNIVKKYGLVPKTAMPETFQSEYSDEMNEILINLLQSSACKIINEKKDNKVDEIIEDTKKQIYNTVVKFLGEPCQKFDWSYTNEEGESNILVNMTPTDFLQMVIPRPEVLDDFVLLSNFPSKYFQYNKKYEIEYCRNVIEGTNCITLNLPINELEKYALKSVINGIPVWFGADVKKSFHPYYSSLNNKLMNKDLIFGKPAKEMTKEERFLFKNQSTCHAMTITGVNIERNNSAISWEVENSWGYFDNEEPGMDGFLTMSNEWFKEYVGEIVIHKRFLSRRIQRLLDQETEKVKPWNRLAPVLKINNSKHLYLDYKEKLEKK
jgi:bleomycin hydrolase